MKILSWSFSSVASSLSLFGVSVTLVFGGLVGCKETDADKIGDAQACLDRYAREGGGDLNACEALIEGMTSPAAHGIRCATGFIREGFGGAQSFIDAFEEIETVDASSVRSFLRRITFDSAGTTGAANIDTNYTSAVKTYNSCGASGGKGATMIATFTLFTNLLYKYECDDEPGVSPIMGSCDMDDTALAAALGVAYLDTDPSTLALHADLGSIIVNTHRISCSTTASNETLCDFMERAITDGGGASNTAGVGKSFLDVIANP